MICIDLYAENAERHEAKARKWLAEGKPEYAAGSMRKAAKWRERDRAWQRTFYGDHPKTEMQNLLDLYMREAEKAVAAEFESFMYG